MNQILSTSMPTDNKKQKNKIRNTNPTSISSILKFFAIAMLIFGILLIGLGAYSIYEKESKQKEENLQPSISLEDKSNDTVLLKVVYGKNISKLEYRWNDEEETTVNGNNGKYIEQEIKVPTGTNTLHIVITDEDGKQIPYDKQYERESNINFEVSGNKIKITAESEKTIKYMTYRWDDEEEKTIQINNTTLEQEIDAIKGLHTLTVITVDEENNTDTKVQKINGVSKPKVSVTTDDSKSYFIIKASDDEKLSKLQFKINQDDNKEYFFNLDNFKGTIDFKKGCKKATGNENEACMLLSDTAKSIALPMLLCSEEEVEGNHSSSAGKIGEKELFYIMSRGFELKEAMKLMVRARFNQILEKIENEELREEILQEIDKRLD